MKGKVVRPVAKFNGLFQNSKGYVLGESVEYPDSWVIAWYPAKAPYVSIHDEEDFNVVDEEYDFSHLKKIDLDFSDILYEEDQETLSQLL